MNMKKRRIDTLLIHAGEPDPLVEGAVSVPVYQTSTIEYKGLPSYHDLKYIRLNNTPNHVALHRKLAALEKGDSALVTASGVAAIPTTLLTFLSSGEPTISSPRISRPLEAYATS